MLLTILSQISPQELKSKLMGEQKLTSSEDGGIGSIIGSIFGITLGIFAVVLNYRRNHSIFYAILAAMFSEFYLAYVVVTILFKKFNIQ